MNDEVHVKTSNHNRYVVKSLVHATRVLESFQTAGDVLRLRDVVTRTGFNKGMCFRLLYTLHQCGFLDKVGENHYRLATEVRRRRLYRIGYAGQGQDTSFDREVRDGLMRAAEREHVELLVVDNRYQPKIALRSADYLIKEQVDLVVEFQTDEMIAPAIASKYLEANIPFIAIDIPHPGATYFGANNYQAGKMAGVVLGQFAKTSWKSRFHRVVLLEPEQTSTNVHARIAGVLLGIRSVLGEIDEARVVHLEAAAGHVESSQRAVTVLLKKTDRGQRLLISGFNDLCAVGALRAVREAGRENDVAIVGQNAAREGREEIHRNGSRLIASIAYFPEKYGARLVQLAADLVARRQVPPAMYTNHVVLDRRNIGFYYPVSA